MKITRKYSKKRSRKFKKNAKRLAAYSAAAAATMAAQNRSVNAAEIVWDIPDIAASSSSEGMRFQMTNGNVYASTYGFYYYSQGNFRLDNVSGGYLYGPAYSISAIPNLGFVGSITPPSSTNVAYITPRASSDAVSADQPFVLGPSHYYNRFGYLSWAEGQIGFAGVRFDLPSGTHYGWVQITKNDANDFTLNGFGYNDTPGATSLPTNTREIIGDFDGNEILDSTDWLVLRDSWNVDADGDLDDNGVTDINDFGLFEKSYEFENGGGEFAAMVAAAAVPEPSSILLLAVGAAGLGVWRNKRG